MEGKPRGKFPSVQRTRILLFFIKKADCMLSKSDLWEREWGNCLMIEAKMYIQIFFSFLVLTFCYIAPLY